jgi:hypothetical protein
MILDQGKFGAEILLDSRSREIATGFMLEIHLKLTHAKTSLDTHAMFP